MERPLPVASIVELVSQVADGLAYAHGQGIFHRDVKPTNVLLASADWAMLGDFGIARALGDMTRLSRPVRHHRDAGLHGAGAVVGGDIDGRADVYSLGIVLYQLLTRSVPFTAPTAEGLMRQHLEMLVPSLSSRQPDLRRGSRTSSTAPGRGRRYRHARRAQGCPRRCGEAGRDGRLRGQTNLAGRTVGDRAGPRTDDARCAATASGGEGGTTFTRWRGERCAGRAGARSRGASRRRSGVHRRRRAAGAEDDRAPTATVGSAAIQPAQPRRQRLRLSPLLPRARRRQRHGCAAEADRAPTDSNCE